MESVLFVNNQFFNQFVYHQMSASIVTDGFQYEIPIASL